MNELYSVKIKVKRAQMRYSGADRLDITVKSAQGDARKLTPTWSMVMDHKKGKITDQQYTQQYLARIDSGDCDDQFPFVFLYDFGRKHNNSITFVCYCPDGVFCHTHLLINFLVGTYPHHFEDVR